MIYSIKIPKGNAHKSFFVKDCAAKRHHRIEIFRIPTQRERSISVDGHSDISEYIPGGRIEYSIALILYTCRGGSLLFLGRHGGI